MSEHNGLQQLKMQFTGFLAEGQGFLRMPLMDELTSTMPKDANVQLLVYHGEVSSGAEIPWHLHLGPLITVVVEGEMIFQIGQNAYHYKAGDVLVEPMGVVHRAYNPNPEVTLAALCIQLTPEGKDHIIVVGQGPTDEKPLIAPPGPVFPEAGPVGKLVGS